MRAPLPPPPPRPADPQHSVLPAAAPAAATALPPSLALAEALMRCHEEALRRAEEAVAPGEARLAACARMLFLGDGPFAHMQVGWRGGLGGGGPAGRVRTDAVSRRRLFCRWGGEGEGASWALCSDKYTALPFLSSTGQITSAAGTPLDVLPRLVLPVSSHTQGSLLQQLAHHLLDGIEGTLDLCNIRVRGKWGKDKCGGGGAGSWRHQDKRGRKGGDIRGGGGRGHA